MDWRTAGRTPDASVNCAARLRSGSTLGKPTRKIQMPIVQHNPPELYPRYRCYSHATEVRGDTRLLIISGLNGYLADGKTMPDSFEEQGEIIWQHLGTILQSAEMDYSDLVSLRTYLAGPQYDDSNVRLRVKYLGSHQPALTVVCCQLLDPRWKLEI